MLPVTSARARGRPLKGHGGPIRGTPTTPTCSSGAVIGMDQTAGIMESPRAAGLEWTELAVGDATAPLQVLMEGASHPPTAAVKAPHANPR